ncbi:MAG: bifunctional metallophosphatase/5'-nucleotidase [Clostridiales bacterium]|jgi:5'-nucleotidase|nr:bifunctional metallophosphatase/5'-nucleotidase [Clostridiales bacterium]MCK9349680.1 bifunctional metallophosphatase/5'-nucleotidase [Clostridiales bacterium]NLG30317.1 bifunctional metallophosphatase/5'-nucleotidase [Clostridiaceae bacterium]
MDLRHLVMLHSNDMHGDFFAKETHDRMVGGMSRLSGYVHKVREEEQDPVLYVISGDMLQGSIIDQEYRGISTILVMNMLEPDVVTLGNHEMDYGFSHLMFLERCANFPIVNANLYIKPTESNLFKPYHIIEIDGIRILFIGIITEEIIAKSKSEPLIGTFIGIEDAAEEVEYICNSYKDVDIDLTVLLTHIGFDQDIELAKLLPPEIGVDLIIGGHSHTMLEQPEKINDILIAQVGSGTEHIGRFDLIINMDTNSVHEFTWKAVPIDDTHCPNDPVMDELLSNYQEEVDGKYNSVICRLPHEMEHENRFRETELGNLFADILRYQLGVDIVFVASGSIRKKKMSRLVTRTDIMEIYPYDEALISFSVDGATLRKMLTHLMDSLYHHGSREFYQWNAELRANIEADGKIGEVWLKGEDLDPNKEYRIAMQDYHYGIIADTFGITHEELDKKGRVRVVSTSAQDNVIEYFRRQKVARSRRDGRINMTMALEER